MKNLIKELIFSKDAGLEPGLLQKNRCFHLANSKNDYFDGSCSTK